MGERKSGKRNPSPAHKQIPNKPTRKSLNGQENQKPHSIPSNLRNLQKPKTGIINYVVDTNVFKDDSNALFKFEEHDVILVSQVWKELDKTKKGHSDEAFNSRKTIRTIDSLVAGKTAVELKNGIPLIPPKELLNGKPHTGRLILDFTKPTIPSGLDIDLSLDEPDERIIMICLSLKAQGKRVVLVSNDGNCRVKAAIAGIEAEEYLNDTTVGIVGEEDVITGFHHMPSDFWEKNKSDIEPKAIDKFFQYRLKHPCLKKVFCNEFLIFKDGLKLQVVNKISSTEVIAETFTNFQHHKVFGVTPRNLQQELALQLLIDERIRGLSIAGLAGSSKTLLVLAAALHLTFDLKLYNRIIFTRPTIPASEDIGFLPGTEQEKMDPWMGAMHDNLELLTTKKINGEEADDNEKLMATSLLLRRIQVRSLNFMKGRTFNNTLIIVDEAQDNSPELMKKIATRVGEGSKIVFLGNVAQIDNNYLNEHTCGISVFIRAFADSELSGHITLQRGERTPFATEAEARL